MKVTLTAMNTALSIIMLSAICTFFIDCASAQTPNPELYTLELSTTAPSTVSIGDSIPLYVQVYYDGMPVSGNASDYLSDVQFSSSKEMNEAMVVSFGGHWSCTVNLDESGRASTTATAVGAGDVMLYAQVAIANLPGESGGQSHMLDRAVEFRVIPAPDAYPELYTMELSAVPSTVHVGDTITLYAQMYYDGAPPVSGNASKFIGPVHFLSNATDPFNAEFTLDPNNSLVSFPTSQAYFDSSGRATITATANKAGTSTICAIALIAIPQFRSDDAPYDIWKYVTVNILDPATPTPTPSPGPTVTPTPSPAPSSTPTPTPAQPPAQSVQTPIIQSASAQDDQPELTQTSLIPGAELTNIAQQGNRGPNDKLFIGVGTVLGAIVIGIIGISMRKE